MDKYGNTSITTEYIRQRIPLQATGRLLTNGNSKHNERIKQLVNQLRFSETSNEEDDKLAELRNELESEFERMHEQQGSEIAATEKRLQSLKEIHRQRGENQAQIVQRRIDQLLGRSDPLDWNYTPPNTPNGPVSPHFSNQYGSNSYDYLSLPGRQPNAHYGSSPQLNSAFTNGTRELNQNQSRTGPQQLPTTKAMPRSYPSKIKDAFEAVTKASETALSEQSNRDRLSEYTRLHEKGALPAAELRTATLEYTTAQKRLALLKLQLQSIQRELSRNLKSAELDLATLIEQRKSNPSANAKSTQLERQQAESAITEARDAIAQFEAAMKLIPASADLADAPEIPSERAEQPTPELDGPTDESEASEDTTPDLESENPESTPQQPIPSS